MGQLTGILSVHAHVGCGAGHTSDSEKSNTGPHKRSQLRNLMAGSATNGNNVERRVRLRPSSEELPPLLRCFLGQEEGALIIEGLLNIAWGLRRPIRLQIQDDREPMHLSSASLVPGQSSYHLKEPLLKDVRVSAQRPSIQPSEHRAESSRDSSEPLEEDKEVPQLMRTKSDAGCVIQRRPRCRTPSETQRIRQHRFSINGHFYNHKTSVFTPAYGSMTNVRVSSTMTTLKVLTLLLNKFRVENSPSEFALYIVHESGERTKLKDCEYPLISRILHGPCEKIARIFLMEADLGEEVPHDVAQYIKFEMPVLDSFVEKLKEEEQREIIKLTMKFQALRLMMLQRLEQLVEAK